MLDIKFIRENSDLVKKSVEDRGLQDEINIDELLHTESEYRSFLQNVEQHRALKNKLSGDISKVGEAEKEKLISEAAGVKVELSKLEKELDDRHWKLEKMMGDVPNLVAKDVPVGGGEDDNKILREWGAPTSFDFKPKDHVEIGEDLDLIDIETSAKVSGSRFNYLKNEAVLLQFALSQFISGTLTDKKIIKKIAKEVGSPNDKIFTLVLPPVIAKAEVMKKMDRYDPIEDRYYFEKDDILFVGSTEHTLGPMFMDDTLSEEMLPVRLLGYSSAFRREAGTYGKDTRGILRRHQFDQWEFECFTLPEHGKSEQDFLVAAQEYLVQQLGIPYQVVVLCTGEMGGKADYRQVDINCWMPGQNKYRETHTSDYMTDFQARRLNTRYKRKSGETGFVYMNDATGFAMGRMIMSILENYQQKDGSVKVPVVLQKYLNGLTHIKKR